MMYCFDTDVLSTAMKPDPPLALVRRLAALPAAHQSTTAITVGEMAYGVAKHGRADLAGRVRALLESAVTVLPFDARAAGVIHTDLSDHFIRAEVCHYEDFVKHGTMQALKEKGLLRLEGKEYRVKDGDILTGSLRLVRTRHDNGTRIEAYQIVGDACRANGKALGMGGVYDKDNASHYIKGGARMVLSGSDHNYILAGAKARSDILRVVRPTRGRTA